MPETGDDRPSLPDLPDELIDRLYHVLHGDRALRDDLVEALCAEQPSQAPAIRRHVAHIDDLEAETRPSPPLSTPVDHPGLEPGQQVGPYRILSLLGQGGMGSVYLAEQREPVRRRVALKVIKLGMDSVDVLRRFELERQALAVMSHGNIARVFDAGTTERGQPFFAMEHVPGMPLTAYADLRKLSIRERIALFQSVCAAVQHAHQKGVIHRDLKPNNILVTEEQGAATPKIIDFGLARATDHMLTQQTLYTRAGQVMGTPEYMSPEQGSPSGIDIDTRTDVYSLGMILYELLAGSLPFSFDRSGGHDLARLQRRILEEEPPRPSTQLSSHHDVSTRTARARSTTPNVLRRALRNDLDWVVLKAIEKDRNRRYGSAAALAADLQRYLDHEPLEAGPPTSWYRVKKLMRRYRPQFIAASLVMVTAVAGAVVALIYWQRAVERSAVIERQEAATRLVTSLRTGQKEVAGLYPAWPESLPTIEAWLDAFSGVQRDLPAVEAAIAELRAGATPHPANDECLAQLTAQLAAHRRALDVSEGRRRPPEASPVPAANTVPSATLADAEELVRLDRTTFGREAEGLALARCARAEASSAEERAAADRVVAAALFALGLDDDAVATARAAVEQAAGDEQRAMCEEMLVGIEAAIREGRGEAGRRALAELEQRIESLSDELRWWDFAERGKRFVHKSFVEAKRELRHFEAATIPHVRALRSWAAGLEAASIDRYRDRWEKARAAIAEADGVVASELYAEARIDLVPQMGLVPIGMNPVTKLWEFYHLRSAWIAGADTGPADVPVPSADDYGPAGELRVHGATGIVFVLLPGGPCWLGSQRDRRRDRHYTPRAKDDEFVHHELQRARLAPFFLARHELTKGQWKRLTGEEPSRLRIGVHYGGDEEAIGYAHPVESVSWVDCSTAMAHHGLALPTEAQWEYACRAGTGTPWFSARASLSSFGNVLLVRDGAVDVEPDGYESLAPVGRYRPNAFGLYDMHGNALEWCRDVYHWPMYPPREGDGLRGAPPNTTSRVYRGGSFQHPAEHARSSRRHKGAPEDHWSQLGLRAARPVLAPR